MSRGTPYLQKLVLRHDKIEHYEEYPFNIPAIKALQALEFHQNVTFLIGENGSGKSTLLEAIALHQGFSLEGGTKNVNLTTHDNASVLKDYLTISKGAIRPSDNYFLRAESFYNVATYMEELGYFDEEGKTLHERSHGESFMSIMQNKLRGKGLYIFDEPEAALSPSRQLAFLCVLNDLVKRNSQFIIATHSPIILAYPNAKIILLDDTGIKEVKYKEAPPFQVTKNFLDNPERMLGLLLND